MKKVITKADYIRRASDEELVEIINDSDEQLVIASCNKRYCEYSSEDGTCDGVSKGKCKIAIKKWLQSPMEEGKPWYE